MLIQCTKKLLDQLDRKPVSGMEEGPLFSWHANLLTVNRRKTLVLVNDVTRYVVVLYGLKGKDFKKLDELIVQGIREAFQLEGIKEDVIESYLEHSQEVAFTKTKDRTLVSRMNRACDTVCSYSGELETEPIFNSRVGKMTSTFLVGDGKKSYLYPNEELYRELEDFAGEPIFSSRAVQLKVFLKLESHSVWRRLIVPLNWTFPELHKIIQIAFEWQDQHLHEFSFYGEEKSGAFSNPKEDLVEKRPVLALVCTDEAFVYPRKYEMKLETGIKLAEYLPAHSYLTYTYDFGDDWIHEVEVEKTIEEYDAPYPVCLEGEGNTPPEDVGGSHGYEEFLHILANPQHPDYDHMLRWGKMQGYKPFDLEQVNRSLKRV